MTRRELSHFVRDVKAPVFLRPDLRSRRVFPSFQNHLDWGGNSTVAAPTSQFSKSKLQRLLSCAPPMALQCGGIGSLRFVAFSLRHQFLSRLRFVALSLSLAPIPFSSLPAVFREAGIPNWRPLHFLFGLPNGFSLLLWICYRCICFLIKDPWLLWWIFELVFDPWIKNERARLVLTSVDQERRKSACT